MDKLQVLGKMFVLFCSSILLIPGIAFPQSGIVKTIRDFEGIIRQHSFIENKLVFVEENDNGIGDEDMWIYDLGSKEIEHVSSSLEHYASSFFVYEHYILFNQNGFIVQHDIISKQVDTLSLESNNFVSTDFRNAVRLGNSVYFTEDQLLWKLNTETKELVFIGTQGYIIGNGSEHLYLKYRQNINVFDITSQKSSEVHSTNHYYDIANTAVLGENLLFIYYRIGTSQMYLVKYDANLKTASTLEVPIVGVNSRELYVFHKIDDDRLIFYDKSSDTFWLYNNQQGQITEVDQVDGEGNALKSYGKFVSNTNEVFFGGYINGIGSSIVKYDLNTAKFSNVISLPDFYDAAYFPLQLFENSRIITTIENYRTDQRLLVDIDLITSSLDTIAEVTAPRNLLFYQNSLLYGMPTSSYGPYELYRYDFSTRQSSLIEGSYLPSDDSYTYQSKITQYNNEIVFMWDNYNTFRTIDDSYIDKILEEEACDYYVLLGDTLTTSGDYRKKVDGSTIDTVYTLDLTLYAFELGVSAYNSGTDSPFLRAEEQDADTYQWFACEDKTPIANETSRDFYYTSEGYYGVALTKGSCIDTTGCPIFVQLEERACNKYNFFGNELSSSGSYEFFQQNYNSVDTVFQLDLVIDEINTAVLQVEDSLSQEYIHLISEEKEADHYQWVSCDGLNPIAGEVNSSLATSVEGEYALVMSKGACQVTTDCYSNVILGVENKSITTLIYPNPTSSAVKIEVTHFSSSLVITIFDIIGNSVNEYTAKQLYEGSPIIVSDKPGLYQVCITDNNYFDCYKVVVVK